MKFDHTYYVPILKLKQNEKKALVDIGKDPKAAAKIIPFFEVVARNPAKETTLKEHLDTAFKQLDMAVSPYPRFLIDSREAGQTWPTAAAATFKRASAAGLSFTPVTGISRTLDVLPSLEHRDNGIALRLTRGDLETGTLAVSLNAFIKRHGLAQASVDLVVDLGAVDDLVEEGVISLANNFVASIPDKRSWRTLTLSSCAFPKGMGGVKKNSHELVERLDWKVWQREFHAKRRGLERVPTYSDCGIQHPSGVEGFDFRTMQVSAAVRYTLADDWLLIKGESTKKRRPTNQFRELARKLVSGELRSHFLGASHCPGCFGIKAAADGAAGFGSAGVWRRLGTTHHISMVSGGLAKKPSP